jgi:hypothetical protein
MLKTTGVALTKLDPPQLEASTKSQNYPLTIEGEGKQPTGFLNIK